MASNANDILVNLRFNYSEVNKAVNKINNSFKKLDGVASTVKKQQVEVSKMTQALNGLGLAGNSVGGIFGKLFAKVGVWLGITTIVYSLLRGFGALAKEMKTLEDATVRINRVMQGDANLRIEQTKSVYAFARAMNVLTATSYTDTINATEESIKAGFEFAESLQLTRAALIASNIAEMDTANSTKYLIATIRQFGMEAKDSLSIINQWNELGQRTGATTKGIAEVVARAGGTFASVGGSLSQLNAIAATLLETTAMSGEKIGTALKTISARFADVIRTSSFSDEIDKLILPNGKKLLEVYDKNTKMFNSFFDVTLDLSKVWKDLNDVQKVGITKAIAGVRQYNIYMALMQNFDSVVRGLVISIDSNNSALTENEQRVKSLDFKIRSLQGSVSQLALNSGGLLEITKFLVDALTAFMRIITKIKIPTFSVQIVAATVALTAMYFGYMKLIPIMSTFIATLKTTTISVTMLKTAINPLAGVLTVLTTGLVWWTMSSQMANDAQERLLATIADDGRAMYNSRKELEKNIKVFVEYYKQGKYVKEIDEMFKNVTGTSFTDAIQGATDLATAIKKIKDKLADTTELETALDTYVLKMAQAQEKMSGWSKFWSGKDELFGAKQNVANFIKSMGGDSLENIGKELKKLDDFQKKYNKATSKYYIDMTPEEKTNFDNLTKEGRILETTLQNLLGKGVDTSNYKKILLELQSLLTPIAFEEALNKNNIGEELTEEQKKLAQEYADAVEKANKDALKAIADYQKRVMQANANFMKPIVDELFTLKEGQTLADNLTNAMAAFGNNLYNITKDSIVQGIVDGMQMKEVYEELGRSIRTTTTDLFKSISGGFIGEDIVKTTMGGAGLGAFTAGATGKDTGSGALIGAGISALMMTNPVTAPFALLGGALGGLFGAQKPDKNKDVDESLKYQRESTKELKEVNRNLVLMRQDLRPWEYISDSYFFSQATNRGFVGA